MRLCVHAGSGKRPAADANSSHDGPAEKKVKCSSEWDRGKCSLLACAEFEYGRATLVPRYSRVGARTAAVGKPAMWSVAALAEGGKALGENVWRALNTETALQCRGTAESGRGCALRTAVGKRAMLTVTALA